MGTPLTVVIDTREKPRAIGGIIRYFDDHGIKHISSKLYCGDYQLLSNGNRVIDRKQNLLEVCSNLTQQHVRFRAELERAQDAGIQMIILIEQGNLLRSIDDVKQWRNPRLYTYCKKYGIPTRNMDAEIRNFVAHGGQKPPVSGPWLARTMHTVEEKYGVRFEFCGKDDTGRRIMEILTRDEPAGN